MNTYRKIGRKPKTRRGAAIVELAICLPVVLLIALGSIQGASLLFLRQALVQASYEGAKVAIRSGDDAAARQAVANVAAGRRIEGLVITTNPANIADANQGDTITVTVTAPGDANSLIPFGVFQGQQVSAQAVMVRE